MPCEVFLGAHASFFSLDQKRAEARVGGTVAPFVDPELYRRHLARKERRFEEELARQLAAGTPDTPSQSPAAPSEKP